MTCALMACHAGKVDETSLGAPGKRVFEFTYAATLTDLPADAKVRVWIPVPASSPYQHVETLESSFPAPTRLAQEPKYGNVIRYFETTTRASGELPFSSKYRIRRHEVRNQQSARAEPLTEEDRRLFLAPNAMVPIEGKQLTQLQGAVLPRERPLELASHFYRTVQAHMVYDKSRPGYGTGNTLWACESGFGNCTDFHSLFISMSRSKGLPARFEMGFPLPAEPGDHPIAGYHCWAWFHLEHRGWVPVDISEADKHPELSDYYFGNLTADRVGFTIGRDIDLVPKQSGDPLNFFIYPYVEVNGQSWDPSKIDLRFRAKDLPQASSP